MSQRKHAKGTYRGNPRHGLCGTPTWNSWAWMVARCSDDPKYVKAYRDRGITVCESWRTFERFLADMGERPAGMTLDRINNDGNYEPGNCRWATIAQQNRNKRDTGLVTYKGKTQCAAEWARETGVPYGCIKHRLSKGWPLDDVFNPAKRFRVGKFRYDKQEAA